MESSSFVVCNVLAWSAARKGSGQGLVDGPPRPLKVSSQRTMSGMVPNIVRACAIVWLLAVWQPLASARPTSVVWKEVGSKQEHAPALSSKRAPPSTLIASKLPLVMDGLSSNSGVSALMEPVGSVDVEPSPSSDPSPSPSTSEAASESSSLSHSMSPSPSASSAASVSPSLQMVQAVPVTVALPKSNIKSETGQTSKLTTVSMNSDVQATGAWSTETAPKQSSPGTQPKLAFLRPDSAPKAKILIGVMTAPRHFAGREAIRQTWAKVLNPQNRFFDAELAQWFDLRFFVSELSASQGTLEQRKAIDAELKEEPLIVQLGGFEDSYENLAYKTLGIMTWAYDSGYQHVLKVDDDIFLQLDTLRDWARSIESTQGLHFTYAGEMTYGAAVQTDPLSKWFMGDQYGEEYFPPYAFGPCYFVGSQLVRAIADHRGSLTIYRVEDAGLAIWLNTLFPSGQYNIEPLDNMYYQTQCYNDYAIFTCPVSAKEQYTLQENRERFGTLCGSPSEPFEPEECRIRRCMCYPLTEDACQGEDSTKAYVDLIPRLIQQDAATIETRKN